MMSFKINGTMFYILEDSKAILVSREIHYKNYKMLTKCDGTVGDLGRVTNVVSNLSDEMFMEFSRIQKETNGES